MKKLITWSLVLVLCICLIPAFIPVVKAAPSTWYVATTGSDVAAGDIDHPFKTVQKGVNVSGAGDTIFVRGGSYNEIIYMKASGTTGNPITLTNYNNEHVTINGAGVTIPSGYGLINLFSGTVTGRKNITIKGMTIENSSQIGIRTLDHASDPSSNITIDHCTFKNIGHNAIWLGESQVSSHGYMQYATVSNCTFWKTQALVGTGESITFVGVKNFEFAYNTVLWARTITLDMVSQSNHGKVHHNNFHINESGTGGSASAIHMNGMNENNKTISYIDVYDNVIWGTMVVDCNAISLSGETATGRCFQINIYNNIINITCTTGHEANGIYFADKSEDGTAYAYYNNITIKYNTIYCRDISGSNPIELQCYEVATDDLIITNNIFVTGGATNYQIRSYYMPSTSSDLTYVNNLFYHTGKASNTYFSDGTGKFGTDYVKADPQFVSLATYDFHLNQTSPAINVASASYIIDTDFNGISRPQGAGYDIGACEYNGYAGDSTAPVISQVGVATSILIDTLAGYGWENFTCVVTDNVGVSIVLLKFTNPNQSTTNVPMIKKTGTTTYYANQSLHQQGNYSYRIQATDTSNNVAFSSSYTFSLPPNWDINYDGIVKILDLVLVGNHYGETGDPGWIREDVDNNGKIESLDIQLVANNFDKSWWM